MRSCASSAAGLAASPARYGEAGVTDQAAGAGDRCLELADALAEAACVLVGMGDGVNRRWRPRAPSRRASGSRLHGRARGVPGTWRGSAWRGRTPPAAHSASSRGRREDAARLALDAVDATPSSQAASMRSSGRASKSAMSLCSPLRSSSRMERRSGCPREEGSGGGTARLVAGCVVVGEQPGVVTPWRERARQVVSPALDPPSATAASSPWARMTSASSTPSTITTSEALVSWAR